MFLEPSSERADLRNAPDASSGFWRSGHRPTLIAAFLYFDLAFMVWVILGPLAPSISADLGLNAAEKGLMVATPTLAGAVLRILMGLLVDRLGPKMTGAFGQVIVILGLFGAWLAGIDSFTGTLALGLLLGFAGASFAVALPLASRWYPREHQGKAMGIAGMGNSGTVLASLLPPGWPRRWAGTRCSASPAFHWSSSSRSISCWRRIRRTARPRRSWLPMPNRSASATPGG